MISYVSINILFQVFYLGEGDGGEDVNDLELETALLN